MRNAIHFLGGSVSVYLLMAACSAGSKHSSSNERPQSTANQGGMGAAGGGADVVANAGTSTPNGMSGGIGGMIGDIMDPVDDADAANVSGTRLRAKYYAGEDGSKQVTFAWRDTKRNEDCMFARIAGGGLRCIPSAAVAAVYFLDAGCTSRVWVQAKAAPTCAAATPANYAYESDATGCIQSLRTVTKTTAPAMVYIGAPSACSGTPAPDVYDYFISSGTIPWTEFVAATEQVE